MSRALAITVARKPLSEGSVARNALKWGTGSLNIDGSRVGTSEQLQGGAGGLLSNVRDGTDWGIHAGPDDNGFRQSPLGRWPANLILQHGQECRRVGTKKIRGTGPGAGGGFKTGKFSGTVGEGEYTGTQFEGFADADGTETIDAWECVEGCPVADLDEQSGVQVSGTAIQRHGGGQNLFGGIADRDNPRLVREDAGYGDTGGASRYFKQVEP